MHYFIVSFTYKNSSLEVRESLDLSSEKQHVDFLQPLAEHHAFDELMLCNTCNRIEIIALVKDEDLAKELIYTHLAKRSPMSEKFLQEQADIYHNEAAIHHLFSVAASLDSLVVGETQIAGQLKDALRFAQASDFCHHGLEKALVCAFKCAAEIRSTTNISAKPVSIASIAVLKAKDEFGSLDDLNALVIGSGDMSRIACQHLLQHGSKVTLINRTMQKALDIQKDLNGEIEVATFEDLPQLLNANELLFSATSSKEPIITKDMIKDQAFNRVWLDLAVPRDIAPIDDEDIKVILVDDLADIAKKNMELRNSEALNSYAIVGTKTKAFYEALEINEIEPLIKDMYLKAFEAVALETTRATDKGFIPKDLEKEAHKMGTQIMKRFLHSISNNMREVAQTKSAEHIMSSLTYLLDIDESTSLDIKDKKEYK